MEYLFLTVFTGAKGQSTISEEKILLFQDDEKAEKIRAELQDRHANHDRIAEEWESDSFLGTTTIELFKVDGEKLFPMFLAPIHRHLANRHLTRCDL